MPCTNHPDRDTFSRGLCKSCYHRVLRQENPAHAAKQKAYHTARYAANPEAKKAQSLKWSADNKARKLAVGEAYRDAKRDEINAAIRAYKKRNPALINAGNALRRAKKLSATPKWSDRAALKDIYIEADYFQMHVDHIVPLNHPLVCGLHVPNNLQLMYPVENMRKNNKFDPEAFNAS